MDLSFGEYWFIEICGSCKCWHIRWLYGIKKLRFSTSPLIPSEKSKYWEAVKLRVVDRIISKILIFAWMLVFCHGNIIVSCFPWSDSSLYQFLRKYVPDTQVWITVICQLFLKMVFHAKCTASVYSSVAQILFLDTAILFGYCSRNALCVLPISSPGILKTHSSFET